MRGASDRYWWMALGAAVLVALVIVVANGGTGGGGDGGAGVPGERPPGEPAEPSDDVRDAVRDHEAAGGGQLAAGDVRRRITALQAEDVPVVVVRWAAGCEPCGTELDLLSGIVEDLDDRVAFIGIGDDDAFLDQHPVPFPNLEDVDGAAEIGARKAPTTVIYDRTGKQTFVKRGPYTDRDGLESDIRRYALGEIRLR